jgi:hypothetical protein
VWNSYPLESNSSSDEELVWVHLCVLACTCMRYTFMCQSIYIHHVFWGNLYWLRVQFVGSWNVLATVSSTSLPQKPQQLVIKTFGARDILTACTSSIDGWVMRFDPGLAVEIFWIIVSVTSILNTNHNAYHHMSRSFCVLPHAKFASSRARLWTTAVPFEDVPPHSDSNSSP